MSTKTALIVGASYGIGRALAIGLAREGFDIAIVARGLEGLQETKEAIEPTGRKCIIAQGDISNPEDVDEIFEKVSSSFDSIDILWNGASPFSEDGLTDIETSVIKELSETTVFGTMILTKKALPLLKKGGGRIVNAASDWALPGKVGPAPFSAAKFSLVGFSEGLNNELNSEGIYSTVLYMSEVGSGHSIDDTMTEVIETSGNVILLNDIVKTIIFLSSLESAYVPSIFVCGSAT